MLPAPRPPLLGNDLLPKIKEQFKISGQALSAFLQRVSAKEKICRALQQNPPTSFSD